MRMCFTFSQGLLDSLPLRDVSCNFWAYDPSRAVPHRGHGHRNVQRTPVFALADGLEMIYSVSRLNAPNDLHFFTVAIGGNDESNALANGFFGAISKYPFGTAIPTGDRSIETLADDCVVRGVNDSGEQAGNPSTFHCLCRLYCERQATPMSGMPMMRICRATS